MNSDETNKHLQDLMRLSDLIMPLSWLSISSWLGRTLLRRSHQADERAHSGSHRHLPVVPMKVQGGEAHSQTGGLTQSVGRRGGVHCDQRWREGLNWRAGIG